MFLASIAKTAEKSLEEIKLFFLAMAERPKEAPASAIEKKIYDQ